MPRRCCGARFLPSPQQPRRDGDPEGSEPVLGAEPVPDRPPRGGGHPRHAESQMYRPHAVVPAAAERKLQPMFAGLHHPQTALVRSEGEVAAMTSVEGDREHHAAVTAVGHLIREVGTPAPLRGTGDPGGNPQQQLFPLFQPEGTAEGEHSAVKRQSMLRNIAPRQLPDRFDNPHLTAPALHPEIAEQKTALQPDRFGETDPQCQFMCPGRNGRQCGTAQRRIDPATLILKRNRPLVEPELHTLR